MPKNYASKTQKDVATAYIIDRLLSGALRTGDRVDRNEVAAALGMSRVPVAEAIVQLERDGILSTRFYRGAFVEQFDADIVREHHEVYGLLSGVASGRAALNPTPRLLRELKKFLTAMQTAPDSATFEDSVWEFRRAINHEYAGPRLRAAIGAFQSFMPKAFWISYDDHQAIMLPFYQAEYLAIRHKDPGAAQAACTERSKKMAEIVNRELVRRGVFADEETQGAESGKSPSAAVTKLGKPRAVRSRGGMRSL